MEWLCVLGFDEVTYASIVVSVQTLTSVECLLIMFFLCLMEKVEAILFMMKKKSCNTVSSYCREGDNRTRFLEIFV